MPLFRPIVLLGGLTALALAPAAPDDPFGTPPPGEPAVRFAPGVVSAGDAFASTFTPDGRTVFFTRTDPDRTAIRLMASHWRDGQWSTPVAAPFASAWREMDPSVAPDGRVYFTSARPRPGATPADTALDYDTWMAPRAGAGWGAAVRVDGASAVGAHDMYPSVTRDGTIYFDSARPGGPGRRNVWRVRPRTGGGWHEAELLPVAVNGTTGATNPFVDPFERWLVFSAVRPGGHGRSDLWISHRTPDGGWTEARNLGPLVNTADVEFCPNVPTGSGALLFSRIRFEGEVRAGQDVFVVDVGVLGG